MSEECADKEKEKKTCAECISLRKLDLTEPNVFCIHVNVAIFGLLRDNNKKNGPRNTHKDNKKETLHLFRKHVSALQNTKGGYIVVHFIGLDTGDSYIGHFDDYFGGGLNNIIANGKFFTDAYSRKWLTDTHLKIYVEQSDVVCTANFSSKQGTDHELLDISLENVLTVLKSNTGPDTGTDTGTDTDPQVRGIELLNSCFEDKQIQVKAFKPNQDSDVTADVTKFTDYLWNKLKLRENLSAMTKVAGGGSYFVGVSEKQETRSYQHCQEDIHLANQEYNSKRLNIDGLILPFKEEDIRREIYKKINTNVSILETSGTIKTEVNPQEIIRVEFHKVPATPRYVIEVAIGHVSGIVFYDKKGPRSYVVNEGKIDRIPFKTLVNKYSELAKKRQ